MKKLNEKRDELAREYDNNYAEHLDVTEAVAFIKGFDAALAELMPMMLEMCEAIRYVMAENDKVKGWDKLHDVFYKYKKVKGWDKLHDVFYKYKELVGE